MAEDKSKDKGERYDRQLRLWGQDGQSKLESAKVLCLTASVTASEALKDLVLPGIGSFTLVDGAVVTAQDLGNHFFVTTADLGKSRAETVTRLLLQHNPFVTGHAVNEDPNTLAVSKPEFVDDFNLVIATQLSRPALSAVARRCALKNITLVVARSYGLLGVVRLQSNEHIVLDSKPAQPVEDVRITAPFPSLRAFVDRYDLASLDNKAHQHLPYAVLLIKALDSWRAAHGGALPSTRQEKDEFKRSLQAMSRSTGLLDSNVEEAVKAMLKSIQPPRIPPAVAAVLADPKAADPPADSDYWITMAAFKKFVDGPGAGCLPLQGSIPDMHADTNTYIALQNVYNTKASEDIAAITALAGAISAEKNRPPPPEAFIHDLCRNGHYTSVIRYTCVADHLGADASAAFKSELASALESCSGNHAAFYVLLRAVDHFHLQHKRYPGVFDDEVEGDIPLLQASLAAVAADFGLDATKVSAVLVAEMVRFGATELHTIASIIGGVVAQEVLKLLTGKWVPFNSTFVFDGLTASGATFAF